MGTGTGCAHARCDTACMSAPVTVIIPTMGRMPHLRECVASVAACDPAPAEVILADQSGKEIVHQVARESGIENIRVVSSETRGAGTNRNRGAWAATQPILAFTDDDCRVSRGWVGVAADVLGPGDVAMMTGHVGDGGDASRNTASSAKLPPWGRRDYTLARSEFWCVIGNNIAARRQEFLDAGGFDERLVAGADIELGLRWLSAGHRIRYEPEFAVDHVNLRGDEDLARAHGNYRHGSGRIYGIMLVTGPHRRMMLRLLAHELLRPIARVIKRSWDDDTQRELDRITLRKVPAGFVSGLRDVLVGPARGKWDNAALERQPQRLRSA